MKPQCSLSLLPSLIIRGPCEYTGPPIAWIIHETHPISRSADQQSQSSLQPSVPFALEPTCSWVPGIRTGHLGVGWRVCSAQKKSAFPLRKLKDSCNYPCAPWSWEISPQHSETLNDHKKYDKNLAWKCKDSLLDNF